MSYIESMTELVDNDEALDNDVEAFTFQEVQAIRRSTFDSMTPQAREQRDLISARIAQTVENELNYDLASPMERADRQTHFEHGIEDEINREGLLTHSHDRPEHYVLRYPYSPPTKEPPNHLSTHPLQNISPPQPTGLQWPRTAFNAPN